MKNKLLIIATYALIVAVIVVVVLKFLGHENPTVTAGAIAGGIGGALGSLLLKQKKE